MKTSYVLIETKLGWIGILGSEAGLRCIILPEDSSEAVLSAFGNRLTDAIHDTSFFGDLPHRLRQYLDGEVVSFADSVDLSSANPFPRRVWQATCSIPYGETRSYAWVAQQVGMPQAARAVGQALKRNPLPIVVPCHRVIGAKGELRGFYGGLQMKQCLLEIEALRN
jgi:O-6-methylguanine DNA methyltransferase